MVESDTPEREGKELRAQGVFTEVLGVAWGPVLSGPSRATQGCSSEHLRTHWRRRGNSLAEKRS